MRYNRTDALQEVSRGETLVGRRETYTLFPRKSLSMRLNSVLAIEDSVLLFSTFLRYR